MTKKTTDAGELRGLIVEVLASRGAYSGYYTEGRGMLAKALDMLGLDRKKLEAAARQEYAAAQKPAKSKPAPKTTAKPKKGKRS